MNKQTVFTRTNEYIFYFLSGGGGGLQENKYSQCLWRNVKQKASFMNKS